MAITLSTLDRFHLQNPFTAAKTTKFPTKLILGYTHLTVSTLLHYLGKLKNQKYALCMDVKHVDGSQPLKLMHWILYS